MINLTIDNSYSQIQGLSAQHHAALRKILSYTKAPEAAYYGRGFPRRYYLLDKQGYFPTGLLSKVMTFTIANGLECNINDLRCLPTIRPTPFKTIKPYPAQLAACKAAIRHARGGIVMPTGTGKSLVIGLIASKLGVKTLVVVPTLEIKKQLSAALKSCTSVKVENIDSRSLINETDYDCLIIDECHHAAAKTYQTLNKKSWNKITYRFFLTATYFRNDTNEQLLFEGIAGDVIFELTYKEAIAKGYIAPVEAYYIDLPKRASSASSWSEVYSTHVVRNDARNEAIARLLRGFTHMGVPTLCLVKEVAHGEAIRGLSTCHFVHGQDDESRRYISQFNAGVIKTLIGTTGILGEGIDSRPCEYVIIAGLGKAKSAFMQQVGRAVRKYPGKESAKVILFRDPSHKYLLRHFNAQKKILLDEYGVSIIRLDLD